MGHLILPIHRRQRRLQRSDGAGGGGAALRPRQSLEQRGDRTVVATQHRQVQHHRDQRRLTGGESLIQQRHTRLGIQRAHPGAAHACQVGLAEVLGHRARRRPIAPGEGHRGLTGGTPTGGKGVEIAVRGRVVPLPRSAQHPGDGGEQHERRQPEPSGQLVQMRGRIRLRTQYGLQPLHREPAQDRVIQHTSGVDHPTERPRHRVQQGLGLTPVGDVTGDDPHVGAGGFQLLPQLCGSGRGGALP